MLGVHELLPSPEKNLMQFCNQDSLLREGLHVKAQELREPITTNSMPIEKIADNTTLLVLGLRLSY